VPPATSAALDLLRAIAACLVVVQHARIVSLPNWADLSAGDRGPLTVAVYYLASQGHASVMAFFVMSGYLVGGGFLVDVIAGRAQLSRYLTSRVARIYTVLVPALMVGYAMDFASIDVLHSTVGNAALPIAAPTFKSLLGNLASLQTIAVPPLGSNMALWSLANEFWYYILWPLGVLALSPRQTPRSRCLFGLLGAGVAWLTYPSILALFPLWCLGALARLAPRPLIRSWLLAVTAAAVAFGCNRLGRNLLGGWLTDCVTSLGLANLLVTIQFLVDVPAPRWAPCFKLLANFSYSLYATHIPIIVLAATVLTSRFGLPLHQLSWSGYVLGCILVGAAYAGSWVFSLWTERYTRQVRILLDRVRNGPA
jgi:peptidoglycan/LPS O-acetylase OafA/YrhL